MGCSLSEMSKKCNVYKINENCYRRVLCRLKFRPSTLLPWPVINTYIALKSLIIEGSALFSTCRITNVVSLVSLPIVWWEDSDFSFREKFPLFIWKQSQTRFHSFQFINLAFIVTKFRNMLFSCALLSGKCKTTHSYMCVLWYIHQYRR